MDERVSRPHDPTDSASPTSPPPPDTSPTAHRPAADTRADYQGVWPIDQRTAEWSTDPAAYEATGMPRHLLLDLVSPGEVLGTITPEASLATGLSCGVPVYATANDKAVEALGCGLLRAEDTVLLSLGTYIAAMTAGTTADAGSEDYWVNFASVPAPISTRATASGAACGR